MEVDVLLKELAQLAINKHVESRLLQIGKKLAYGLKKFADLLNAQTILQLQQIYNVIII